MSHDMNRKGYFNRDPRNRDPRNRDWDRGRGSDLGRGDYRARPPPRRSRSPSRHDDKRRSISPKKEKDVLDDNILSEISKLPEPSELWDIHFQEGGYAGPPQPSLGPPSFPSESMPTPYGSSYQPSSYSGIYSDFPSVPAPAPPEIAQWNQMSLPPPPTPNAPPFVNQEDQMKKEAAIESEMRHQKAALSKQREEYIKKAGILKKELDTLKDQRTELRGDSKRSPSPDTKRFLKENTKLQLEIQNKLKTINNVVDMLNGIIGEEAQLPIDADDSDGSTDRPSKRKSRSPSSGRKFNYVYYDPEMHWCRVCCEFPPTAKDYLNHLHSAAHQKTAAAHMEAPWHTVTGVNEGFPSYPSAPTKRTPIRGLQFFVPSTAWYCKLCDQFIGDLHCASAHLKSVTHSNNYTNFVEQNPHWETDWMSDRQKAFEKSRANKKPSADVKPNPYTSQTITFNKDGVATSKNKKSSPPPAPAADVKKKKKEKKKKKRDSSSSSSESDSSDSEPTKKKKKKKESSRLPSDEKALAEWMSAIQADRLNDNDRKLLDTLRTRYRMKLDKEKEKEKERSPPVRVKRERSASPPRRREPEHHSRDPHPRDRDHSRDARERDREREARDRDRERERERERDRGRRDDTKPPVNRKMPFIGKMPVYKSLSKTKAEEVKKEEEKKKEEEQAAKKRREEMDAEIQKKVAEFKEKIAKAQFERAAATMELQLPPPAIALPTALGAAPPPALLPGPPPSAPPTAPTTPVTVTPKPAAPALAKDFQEALDIIFPSGDVKAELPTADIFGLPPGFPMGLGGVMPPFPPFLQPPMMMGNPFDIFQQQPATQQLYDNHVPLIPGNNKPRPNNNRKPVKKGYQGKNPNPNHNQNKNKNNQNQNQNKNQSNNQNKSKDDESKQNGDAARKREELDDLAMLGIDASDVGSGM